MVVCLGGANNKPYISTTEGEGVDRASLSLAGYAFPHDPGRFLPTPPSLKQSVFCALITTFFSLLSGINLTFSPLRGRRRKLQIPRWRSSWSMASRRQSHSSRSSPL